MNTTRMSDSMFEALFRQAVIDEYTHEIDSILPNETLMDMISFSSDFELRMKQLLAKDHRIEIIKRVLYIGKRAAIFIIVVISIVFCVLLTNSEVRAVVKNTVIEWYDRFTSFLFHEESSSISEMKEWRPDYLTMGYDEASIERLGRATNIEYSNSLGNIIYFSYRPGGNNTNISIDNENHQIESDDINGHEAYIAIATSDDYDNGVIWTMEGYIFSVWSKLSIDELKKIAQSIKK